jgi:hypothetical protein
LNLAWINYNTLSGDDMSKKRNFLQPESTLAELVIKLMVMKSLQNNSEMLCMLFFTLGIDQDVINEDMTNLSNSDMNTEFIKYMKCAGALVSPNDITKYSYNLYLVEKAVLGTSFGRILI